MGISGQNQPLVGTGYVMSSRVLPWLAGVLLLLSFQTQAPGKENALSRQIVSRVIAGHLSKVDSYENSWRYQSTRQMVAWLDMWVWRPEWEWTEATLARVWIAEPQSVAVRFKELRAEGDRLLFDVTVDLPLELKAWHQACEWMETEFGATVDAQIVLRGSFGIESGRIHAPDFTEVRIGLASLEFDRWFCQSIRAPIRSTLNCLLEQQQERLCQVLEAELSGQKLAGP